MSESAVDDADSDPLAAALAGERGADKAIATLRAQGREGLARLLEARANLDRPGTDADWDRVLDAVSGQRDAATSGLYWETDLGAALASAAERGVPVLSLRMLGELTDEFSCANSRFFRALLYTDPELAQWLDESFVLHWSSERPVPSVTIDFGDGRTLRTTTTGNSAHYVLDTDGQVLDVLPGLYDAVAFRSQLRDAVALFEAVQETPGDRTPLVRSHHRKAADAALARVSPLSAGYGPMTAWMRRAPGRTDDMPVPAVAAQPITVSKMRVELPLLKEVDSRAVPARPSRTMLREAASPVSLSPTAIAMIRRDRPQRPTETDADYGERIDALLEQTAEDLALDTFVNEARLHFQIHGWFANGEVDGDFDAINERVYRELFGTPRNDPWLGLRDDTSYDGLAEGPHRIAG